MKVIIYSILALSIVTICTIKFSSQLTAKEISLTNKPKGKVLVVYYSQSKNKNTETIAKWINNAVDGDIYEIEMITPYPKGYQDVLKASKQDIDNNNNPAIKPFTKNISDYDTIFIGSPIWYGTYAPPVGTFLSDHNLKGKTIIPFCTHGGGGAKDFYSNLSKNAKEAIISANGFTAKGSNIIERTLGYGTKNKVSQDDVTIWLNEVFK